MSSTSHAVRARAAAPARSSCVEPFAVHPAGPIAASLTETWRVRGIALPRVRRRCRDCATNLSRATGMFRVNANGRLLDVWLLTRCAHCGHNGRLKVHHRVNVNRLDPERLHGYLDNDPHLIAETLMDPATARRNHCALDWTDAWELIRPPRHALPDGRIDVQVHFEVPAPIRPARLIALGLGLSRGGVERMIGDHRLTSTTDLRRTTSSGFAFTV